MYRLPSEKEEHKYTIGALILSIIIIIAGIGGMIYTLSLIHISEPTRPY